MSQTERTDLDNLSANIDSDLENPRCPLCQANLACTILNGCDDWMPDGATRSLRFSVVRCSVCGVHYTTPRFREDSKQLAFAGSYPFYQRARQISGPPSRREVRVFEARVRAITNACPQPGRILDIGMGDGVFLELMRQQGWKTSGIDTEPDVVSFARQRLGLESCRVADAESDPLPEGPFDVVTMWGMFQLSYRPYELLKKIRSVLSPGGVIGIGVSNISSAGARLFGSHWRGLGLPRHLVHYDPDSLARLVEHTGYQVLGLTFETPYWIVAPSVNAAMPLPGLLGGIARRLACGLLSPLGKTRFGDTMILLARAEVPINSSVPVGHSGEEECDSEKNSPVLP